MLRVRSAEGDVISFIRARADGLRGWLAIYATIMLAASGISVAGISLTARAMEGPSGEAFGSPLLLEPTALAIHTVGKPSGGGAWFLPTNGSIGGYLRSTQNLRPQPWQRWALARPISTMYSKLTLPLRRM